MSGPNVARRLLLAGLLAFLVLFFLFPYILPFIEASQSPALVWDAGELARLARLAFHTLALAAGTLLIALPLGTLAAALLFRTDLPGRRFLLGVVAFALFIPLPVLVSGWQALVGSDGWWPLVFWGANADRPWTQGMLPAIWIHAVAGIPWVVLIVGSGLSSVEPELEEEALLATSPGRVFWRVTLPRCRGSVVAAALWLALQTIGDIVVADMLLIPTFAEEVHIQFTLGGGAALKRAILLSLPAFLAIVVVLALVLPWIAARTSPLQFSPAEGLRFRLRRPRWLWSALLLLAILVMLGAPVLALIWKLGLTGRPLGWSAAEAWRQMLLGLRANSLAVMQMLGVAVATGAVTAGLALLAASWGQRNRRRTAVVLFAAAVAWAMPGPTVGIGLKETIQWILSVAPLAPLETSLYYGPSPAPIVWAHVLRFFPFALAVLWPVVRMIPPELRDLARLEGATPFQEWVHVTLPFAWRGWLVASLTVMALALGEVGAAARVETPGWETFAKLLFDRMHYGVDRDVAALALVLLFWIAVLFGTIAILIRLRLRARPAPRGR